jgi:hypothetical protein
MVDVAYGNESSENTKLLLKSFSVKGENVKQDGGCMKSIFSFQCYGGN